jgi:hypothetical protein
MLTLSLGVIYASITGQRPDAKEVLELALSTLLSTIEEPSKPDVLWSMSYEQLQPASEHSVTKSGDNIYLFSPLSSQPSFDDALLEQVKSVWRQVLGPEAETSEFLVFGDREGDVGDDDEEY